ncbi:MAG: FecR domain-containing protein [Pseudomonadota bacterium]
MQPKKIDTRLLEQALTLLEAANRTPSAENLEALQQWSNKSTAHARAVDAASDLVAHAHKYKPKKRGPMRRWVLSAQLFFIRLLESHSRPIVVLNTVIIASLFSVFLFVLHLQKPPDRIAQKPTISTNILSDNFTTAGEQKTITLTDGTIIWMDWRTRVNLEFTGNKRSIDLLEGSVVFKVAKDVSRPFVVTSGHLSTTVTGTEFSVDARNMKNIEVSVLEGSVVVSDENQVINLTDAQGVKASNSELGAVYRTDPQEIARWRDGVIVFRGTPLSQALKELEHYLPYKVETTYMLNDPVISGTFFIEKSEDAFTTLLEGQNVQLKLIPPNTISIHPALPN